MSITQLQKHCEAFNKLFKMESICVKVNRQIVRVSIQISPFFTLINIVIQGYQILLLNPQLS